MELFKLVSSAILALVGYFRPQQDALWEAFSISLGSHAEPEPHVKTWFAEERNEFLNWEFDQNYDSWNFV